MLQPRKFSRGCGPSHPHTLTPSHCTTHSYNGISHALGSFHSSAVVYRVSYVLVSHICIRTLPPPPLGWPQHCVMRGHKGAVKCLLHPASYSRAYASDHLLSGGADFTVKLWDLYAGVLVHTFAVHGGEVANIISCPPEINVSRRSFSLFTPSQPHTITPSHHHTLTLHIVLTVTLSHKYIRTCTYTNQSHANIPPPAAPPDVCV